MDITLYDKRLNDDFITNINITSLIYDAGDGGMWK